MPRLVSQITAAPGKTILPSDAETPVQRFFLDYAQAVEEGKYFHGSPLQYYSKDLVFHNQNNAVYNGGEQMWPWMQRMFGQFARLQHPIHSMWVMQQEDDGGGKEDGGDFTLMVQMTRNVWAKGDQGTDRAPDVSAPAFWLARVGKADEGCEEATLGLQFKEVWLYWDTALLAPFMSQDSVVFKTKNVVENE